MFIEYPKALYLEAENPESVIVVKDAAEEKAARANGYGDFVRDEAPKRGRKPKAVNDDDQG